MCAGGYTPRGQPWAFFTWNRQQLIQILGPLQGQDERPNLVKNEREKERKPLVKQEPGLEQPPGLLLAMTLDKRFNLLEPQFSHW